MKRKLKWLAVALAVLLLGFGTALFLWPRDRITAHSYEMIDFGMTEKEVEDILGEPGKTNGEYRAYLEALRKIGKAPFFKLAFFEGDAGFVNDEATKRWPGRRGCLTIGFDQGGRVNGKCFSGSDSVGPSFIDRLRDWLGW